ncbi:Uncharacterised protein [Vibrio anguillarum]|nr:Uncharacterised protein [Vibrio anguillarum]
MNKSENTLLALEAALERIKRMRPIIPRGVLISV